LSCIPACLDTAVLWLLPPCESEDGARLAGENHCYFVQGVDIAELSRHISMEKQSQSFEPQNKRNTQKNAS
jgi:hypothetical protein